MREAQRMRGAAAAAMAALVLLATGAVFAQAPGSSPLSGTARQAPRVPAQDSFDPEQLRGRVKEDLARARGRLERIRSGAEPGPPPGITASEVENSRKAIALLPHIYEVQLETLETLVRRRAERAEAEQSEQSWPGFQETPPYSILLWDNVREEVDTRLAAVALFRATRADLALETERFRAKAAQAQEAVRRAAETVEGTAPGTDSHAAAVWRLEVARDGARMDAQFVATGSLVARELEEKQGIAQAQLRLAERKLAALEGKVKISEADLMEVRTRLAAARADQEKELQALVAESAVRSRERDAAAQALESLRRARKDSAIAAAGDGALLLAEARLRAAEARVSSLGGQIRILTILTNVYHELVGEAWSLRHVVLGGGDADARQQASRKLTEMIEYLRAGQSRGRAQQDEVRSAMRAQDERVQAAVDPAIAKFERDALDALSRLDLALDRQQTILKRRLARLAYWQQEFTAALKGFSFTDIAAEALARLKVIASSVWDYELLAIEDQVEIGGKTVTTSRGITVGKSIGAVLLFLVGYRLLLFLSSLAERLLVRRFGIAHEQGRTLRRWANALGLLALALLTLNLARIPLTVFAFAGGALAIGIGFGAQTLIKNLISGMIVLVERQVRVGDTVEVEGVTGTVTAVNIRSSTVRGFDGVETVVPNSALLEQKVTNWTLTSAHLRRSVKVSVANGSAAQAVAQSLAECAESHGLVLKDPAPRVIFENFGDNGLDFTLYFWIDLASGASAMQVSSDLRFMIEKRLGEAGIALATPQREIRIDAAQPLRVQVVPPGPATT